MPDYLFWETTERFVEAGGIGYCTLIDGCVTSACLSAFVDGDVHCVDMETFEPFWRQGHGTVAALDFLRACQDAGKTMHWSCMEDNIASYRLARTIGLDEVGSYTTVGFDYVSRVGM